MVPGYCTCQLKGCCHVIGTVWLPNVAVVYVSRALTERAFLPTRDTVLCVGIQFPGVNWDMYCLYISGFLRSCVDGRLLAMEQLPCR